MNTRLAAYMLTAAFDVAGCASRTVHMSNPPAPREVERLHRRAVTDGVVLLLDGSRRRGSHWQINGNIAAFRNEAGLRDSVRLPEIVKLEVPLSRVDAAWSGTKSGALAVGIIGLGFGVALWQSEPSCSPRPCTPPGGYGDGEASSVAAGALIGTVLGGVLGASVGAVKGGRVRFQFREPRRR